MATTYPTSGTYDFRSIVEALRAQIRAGTGQPAKEYEFNFKGITEAIQDLTITAQAGPAAEVGGQPTGGNVVINDQGVPEWIVSTEPDDGTLWFDTRQGRLFLAYQGEWYQTNGGDGLPIITDTATPPSASNLANGQFWWDAASDKLYIFEGTYKNPDGSITPTPSPDNVPIWLQISFDEDAATQTTATLPTAPLDSVTGSYGTDTVHTKVQTLSALNIIPDIDPDNLKFQKDVNGYFMDCLLALNTVVENQVITMTENPPTTPVTGQLWFDTSEIELSIFYQDVDSSQWVPIFSALMLDDDLKGIKESIATETSTRATLFSNLRSSVDTVEAAALARDVSILSLQGQISNLPVFTASNYKTVSEVNADIANLDAQIKANDSDIGAIYQNFYNKDQVLGIRDTLQADIDSRATSTQLTSLQNSVPSIAGLASTVYVDTKVAAVPNGLSSGGTLRGSITVDKPSLGSYTFNCSNNYWDGYNFLYFKTNTSDGSAAYTTFGTTANLFEYSWAFSGNEDYCWNHGTNGKVASIDRNGIAAEKITIGSFGTNDASGRVLSNTIDVGAKLTAYQAAFEAMRSGINSSTDYDSLKANLLTALANV